MFAKPRKSVTPKSKAGTLKSKVKSGSVVKKPIEIKKKLVKKEEKQVEVTVTEFHPGSDIKLADAKTREIEVFNFAELMTVLTDDEMIALSMSPDIINSPILKKLGLNDEDRKYLAKQFTDMVNSADSDTEVFTRKNGDIAVLTDMYLCGKDTDVVTVTCENSCCFRKFHISTEKLRQKFGDLNIDAFLCDVCIKLV